MTVIQFYPKEWIHVCICFCFLSPCLDDSDTVLPQRVDPRRAKDMAAKHALQTESYTLSRHIDPHTVSAALYAKKIINADDVERAQTKAMGTERERAHSLIMKVIQKVEQNPNLFDRVCDIMKAEGVSVKKLKRKCP